MARYGAVALALGLLLCLAQAEALLCATNCSCGPCKAGTVCQMTSCSPCRAACAPLAPAANAPRPVASSTSASSGGAISGSGSSSSASTSGARSGFAGAPWGALLLRGVPLAGIASGAVPPMYYTGGARSSGAGGGGGVSSSGGSGGSGRRLVAAVAAAAASPAPAVTSVATQQQPQAVSSPAPRATAGNGTATPRPRPAGGFGGSLFRGAGTCPGGKRAVNCFLNPCQFASRRCPEGTTCVANYCGGCSADCLPAAGGVPIPGLGSTEDYRSPGFGAGPVIIARRAPAAAASGSGAPAAAAKPAAGVINTTTSSSNSTRGAKAPGSAAPAAKPAAAPAAAKVPSSAPASGAAPGADAVPLRSWGGCPDGVLPVLCAEDPCVSKQCATGLHCVSNLCGGCNAECVQGRRPAAAAAPKPGSPLI